MRNWTVRYFFAYAAAFMLCGYLITSGSAYAQAPTLNKANNADALNLPSSWAGGAVVPTPTDIAVWEAAVLGANSTVLGDSLQSWLGMRILNPGGAVTIGGPDFVTLGASGIDMSAATQNLTLNNGVQLGAAQTWNVGTGRTLAVGGVISDLAATNTLTKSGRGTLTLTGANTYTSPTVLGQGTLNVNFAGAGAPASNILPATTALSIRQGTSFNVTGAGVIGGAQQSLASTQFGNAAGGMGLGLTTVTVVDADPNNPIPTLNLGTISNSIGANGPALTTKNAGVAVRFVGPATQDAVGAPVPANGHIQVTGTGGTTAVLNGATTTVGRVLGVAAGNNDAGSGYATVGLYDFAAIDTADNNLIKGGSQISDGLFYSSLATNSGWSTGAPQFNIDFTSQVAGNVGGGNRYANTLRFNTPGANTVTFSGSLVHVNGILVTPNMGAQNVVMTGGVSAAIFDNTRSGTDAQHQATFWQNNTNGFLNFDLQYINGQGSTTAARPNALVKAGLGTMVVSHGDSVYTGGTIIYEGALMFSASDTATQGALGAPTETAGPGVPTVRINGGALVGNGAATSLAATRGIGLTGSATIAATNGNKLTVNGIVSDQNSNTSRLTLGLGQIAGTGAGTANTTAQFGSGIVALTGANTYANGTDITNGATLQAVNTTGSATGAGSVTISNASTLAGTGTVAGAALPASGGHVSAGVAGANSGVGTLTVGGLTSVTGSILDFDMSVAQNDLIRSTNGLSIAGGTIVNLFQAGTPGGYGINGVYNMFDVTAGAIPSVATLNSNLTVVNASGGSYLWGVSGTNVTLTITGLANASIWNINGGGVWGANASWSPATSFPNGPGDSATFGNAVLTATTAHVTLNATRTVGVLSFSNTNGASYAIDAAGGSLTLNNNASTAVVSVVNGSHSINAPVTLASDAGISVTNAVDALTISGNISGAKNLSVSGLGKVILSGTNAYAATTIAAGATLQVGAGGATGTVGSGAVALSGTLDVNRNNAASLGAIDGGGTVSNSGSGTTTLTAVNTGAFNTTVNAGKIVVGTGSNLGTGTVTTNGGTLDLNDLSPTVGALAGTGGTVDNSGAVLATLTVSQSGNTTFNGTLADTGAGALQLIKSGVGQLTLGGTTANDGGTVGTVASNIRVEAGSVVLNSAGSLPAGKVLETRVSGTGVFLGPTTIAGTILLHPDSNSSANLLNVTAGSAATLTGTITTPAVMTNGTQTRINAGNNATTSLTVTGSGSIVVTNASVSTFIFEQGNFTFAGNSQLTVGGPSVANAWLGRSAGSTLNFLFRDNSTFTAVNGITLGGGGATTTTAVNVTVQDNAIVNTTVWSLEGSDSNVTTTTNLNGGTVTLNSFTRSATGTTTPVALKLNGAQLNLGASGILVPAAALNTTVSVGAGGAKIDTAGFDATIELPLVHDAALVPADGGLTKSGLGSLFLTGASNGYNGPTRVTAGTLSLAQPTLDDLADVFVTTGATLDLPFTGFTDIIDSLFLDGVGQAVGIYGAIGSGAPIERPYITGGGFLQVSTLGAPPIPGDFNGNGVVNADDLTVWKGAYGSTAAGDADNDLDSDGNDFLVWQRNLGLGGPAVPATGAVPEPGMLTLVALALPALAAARRRRRA